MQWLGGVRIFFLLLLLLLSFPLEKYVSPTKFKCCPSFSSYINRGLNSFNCPLFVLNPFLFFIFQIHLLVFYHIWYLYQIWSSFFDFYYFFNFIPYHLIWFNFYVRFDPYYFNSFFLLFVFNFIIQYLICL